MRLRLQLTILTSITFAAVIMVLYISLNALMLGSYEAIEEKDLLTDLDRATDSLNIKLKELDRIASDWAAWDDAYRFMSDRKRSFIESNLPDKAVANLDVHIILFLDRKAKPFYAKAVDIEKGRQVPLPEGLTDRLSPSAPLFQFKNLTDSSEAIIMLNGRPLLMAARQIITSSFTGPPRGYVVVGRFLDDTLLSRLSQLTHLSITMNRVPEPSPAARTRISKTGRDRIAAESVIPDMYGKPGFILGITAQRAVFQQGLKTSRLTFGALTLCSLVFLGVLLLFAERTVVRKLEEFSRKSEEIAIAPGRPERMDPTGSLEFQSLAHSINRMLDSLDSSSRLIRDNEEKYRAVLHQSCDAIFIIDPDTREILEANQAFFAMTGYSQQDVPGLLMDAVTKDTESIKEKIEKVLSKGEIRVTDRKYHRKDGIRLEVEVAANTIRTGRKTLICLLVRDVTARNEEQRKIRDMAITDMLTGIPNRNYLMQRAVQEFERIRRARSKKISKVSMGCIMIDMDHFKAVNDSLGHLCGDEVLRQCAGRIAGSVRPYDIIGRYGGEEFAVFLSDTELEQTRIVAERIWHAIRSTPFTFKEHSFQMTASIGLAILSPEDLTLSDLLKRADDTLYTAKRNGRDRVEEAPPSSIPLIS